MSASLLGLAQSRPFTLHRQTSRPRWATSVVCKADAGDIQRRVAVGAGGIAAAIASIPKAWAEGLELPSDLTYPGLNVPESLQNLPTDVPGIGQFISDYPLLLPAAAGVVLVPLLISQVNGGGSKVQGVGALRALEVLASEDSVLFVDIRSKEAAKESGSPDLRSVKKSVTRLPFTKVTKGETVFDESFVEKFGKLRAVAEGTTVILLDSFGDEAPQAARGISSIVGQVYYIQGGSDGPRGWKATDAPWTAPGKLGFNLSALKNFGSNIDSFAEDFKAAPTASKAFLGLGALAAGSLLIFQEIDTALEVAGLFAAGQFAVRRLLFAEDRKKTASEIKELVDDKIAVKDVPKDLKKLATKVLETEQATESKVAAKAKAATESVRKDVKKAADNVRADVSKAANNVSADVNKAAEKASKESEKSIDAAKDTIDLNGAGAPANGETTGEKKEAQQWISNWRSGQKKGFFD